MAKKKQPQQRDEKLCTAMHEAGHAVSAVAHGIVVRRVNIIGEMLPDGRPGLGFNEIDYPHLHIFFDRGGDAVRPILVTLYAGSFAEELVDPTVNTRPYSFEEDTRMADLYANAAFRPLVLPTDPMQLEAAKKRAIKSVDALKKKAIKEAERFVKAHRAVIEAVAAALVANGELTGQKIRRIVAQGVG